MMSTLAKSAIVAATVAGASATRLRVEVAAKTNFEDSLQMTSFETSFIEKAFEEHDCVGTTMEQLDDLTKKSAEELRLLEAECEKTGPTSKFQAAQIAHGLKLTHLDQLEKQRTDGDFPVIFDCAGFDTAVAHAAGCDGKSAGGVRKKQISDNKAIFDDQITKSDDRITESKGMITNAEVSLRMTKKRETVHDKQVADDIAEKSKDYDSRISNIASRLKTDKDNLEKNKNNAIADAENDKKEAEDNCDQIKVARDKVIKQDKDLLEEIKGHLETLKICTAAHAAQSSGTAFLEIKAAQRLEAHCAVSRKMVEQAAPTGDITDWSKKIEEEIVTAAANKEKCYAAAEEVERFAVHGPAVTEDDTVSGIVYVYNNAVLGKEFDAQVETSAQETLKGEMEIAENEKKVPYKTATQEAQLALDEAKNDHCDTGSLGDHVSLLQTTGFGTTGQVYKEQSSSSECVSGVVFEEIAEKKRLTTEKEGADEDANEAYNALLGQQKDYLDGKRTALVKAFDVVKKATEKECKESIQELKDEATLITTVRAKIGALQVVHGGSGGGSDHKGVLVEDGTCQSHGFVVAPDQANCEALGRGLGLKSKLGVDGEWVDEGHPAVDPGTVTIFPSSYDHFPPGCIWHPADKEHINPNMHYGGLSLNPKLASEVKCSSKTQCLCERPPPPPDAYVKKGGHSCSGRNELGFKNGYTVKQCEQHCSNLPTCISFEKFSSKCKFSETCKAEISKKDATADLYLRVEAPITTEEAPAVGDAAGNLAGKKRL